MSNIMEMQSYKSPISSPKITFFNKGKERIVSNRYIVSHSRQAYSYSGPVHPVEMFFDTEGPVEVIRETVHTKEIARRFEFLDKSLEDEQDRQVYNFTKKLLCRLLKYITIAICPYIGVADSGQVIAEWHKHNGFKIARLIPLSPKEIVFQGVKENGTIYAITTNLDNLRIQRNKELSPFLE
ncbi:MAG: hypothetical protein LBP32_08915 [Spirochaetaceae bacterium]|jgi:hypothetical protein|nr:hypothetical protein [Spirochaetaceae bacterium]